ncbi:MAG: hypothetical protein ACRERD_20015 [Candidatus Binatia bacterium]
MALEFDTELQQFHVQSLKVQDNPNRQPPEREQPDDPHQQPPEREQSDDPSQQPPERESPNDPRRQPPGLTLSLK